MVANNNNTTVVFKVAVTIVSVIIVVIINNNVKPVNGLPLLLPFMVLFSSSSPPPTTTTSISSSWETRRCVLTTWDSSKSSNTNTDINKNTTAPTVLGWTLERRDPIHQHFGVRFAWTYQQQQDDNEDDDIAIPWTEQNPKIEKSVINTTTSSSSSYIALPFPKPDSLASTLWPAALVGAILLQSPAWRQQLLGHNNDDDDDDTKIRNILELGSGVGLAGLAAAKAIADALLTDGRRRYPYSYCCWLTDNDPQAVELLQQSIEQNHQDILMSGSKDVRLIAQRLDWRDSSELQRLKVISKNVNKITDDDDEEEEEEGEEEGEEDNEDQEEVQVILGTDVCYYFHLLRPMMDTIQRKLQFTNPQATSNLNNKNKLVWLVGQANRQSLWDMYHNIVDGCYNQITDQHEPPWPGTTIMLRYQLYVGRWMAETNESLKEEEHYYVCQEDPAATIETWDGVIPMAVLLHTNQDMTSLRASFLQPYDHIATTADEAAQMKSF